MHSAATAVRWIFALWFARIAMCEHVTTMRPVDSFRRLHPSTRRIIGGTAVTNSSKYPWFAQLVKIGGYGTTCGMTIINKNWAVTACHCVIKHDYTGYNSASGSQLKFGCTSKMRWRSTQPCSRTWRSYSPMLPPTYRLLIHCHNYPRSHRRQHA